MPLESAWGASSTVWEPLVKGNTQVRYLSTTNRKKKRKENTSDFHVADIRPRAGGAVCIKNVYEIIRDYNSLRRMIFFQYDGSAQTFCEMYEKWNSILKRTRTKSWVTVLEFFSFRIASHNSWVISKFQIKTLKKNRENSVRKQSIWTSIIYLYKNSADIYWTFQHFLEL